MYIHKAPLPHVQLYKRQESLYFVRLTNFHKKFRSKELSFASNFDFLNPIYSQPNMEYLRYLIRL